MGRDAKIYDVFSPHTPAGRVRLARFTRRGSSLRRFAPSAKIRKRLFWSLVRIVLVRTSASSTIHQIFFSHGTKHSKGVCILINPLVQDKIDYSFSDKSGRIVLITIVINSLMLSLCNIYAPNNQAEQLEFLQELNNCLIDKSELTTLIVGGDWNCTLSKNDKIGGKPWKATNYRNLVLTTMDILDLVDIQRERHPKLRKYSYESKALKVKSRKTFFWSPKT